MTFKEVVQMIAEWTVIIIVTFTVLFTVMYGIWYIFNSIHVCGG